MKSRRLSWFGCDENETLERATGTVSEEDFGKKKGNKEVVDCEKLK